jgi:hypothetical protein
MVDSDPKNLRDESDDDDERDAPTSVAKVSERLLKALKQRNVTDAKVVSSAPSAKQDAPTQPPPPPDPSNASDEDESATNVLLAKNVPVRRATPPPATSDEDQSETLYAITTQTGQTPVMAVKEARLPAKEQPAADASDSAPIVSPLAAPPPSIWWWAAPLAIAMGIAALVTWILVNHG